MRDLHDIEVRVYYEDTDMAGIVYYANYLKYIERGRTEFLRALGVDQMALKEAEGTVFAVRKVTAEYISPARMDDLLQVRTAIKQATGARVTMTQQVARNGDILFEADVEIVAMGPDGRPKRIPQILRKPAAG